jgi:hypothetical protein
MAHSGWSKPNRAETKFPSFTKTLLALKNTKGKNLDFCQRSKKGNNFIPEVEN